MHLHNSNNNEYLLQRLLNLQRSCLTCSGFIKASQSKQTACSCYSARILNKTDTHCDLCSRFIVDRSRAFVETTTCSCDLLQSGNLPECKSLCLICEKYITKTVQRTERNVSAHPGRCVFHIQHTAVDLACFVCGETILIGRTRLQGILFCPTTLAHTRPQLNINSTVRTA